MWKEDLTKKIWNQITSYKQCYKSRDMSRTGELLLLQELFLKTKPNYKSLGYPQTYNQPWEAY